MLLPLLLRRSHAELISRPREGVTARGRHRPRGLKFEDHRSDGAEEGLVGGGDGVSFRLSVLSVSKIPTFPERVTVTLRHSSMRVLRLEASMVEWAVIWDRRPAAPRAPAARSPGWRGPAHFHNRLDRIQFCNSLDREGDDIVLGYGVGDCEALSSQVPLSQVLS